MGVASPVASSRKYDMVRKYDIVPILRGTTYGWLESVWWSAPTFHCVVIGVGNDDGLVRTPVSVHSRVEDVRERKRCYSPSFE